MWFVQTAIRDLNTPDVVRGQMTASRRPRRPFPPSAPRDGRSAFRPAVDVFRARLDGKNPPAATPRDVLRRFAVYGDAVLKRKLEEMRKHPKALGEARALAKAVGGATHGVRAGATFKRQMERGLGRWTRAALSGERAESLSFAELVDDYVENPGAAGVEDMETPVRRAAGVGAAAARGRARRDARGRLESRPRLRERLWERRERTRERLVKRRDIVARSPHRRFMDLFLDYVFSHEKKISRFRLPR